MTFPPCLLARTLSVALLVSAILPHTPIAAQTPPMVPPTEPAVWMDPFVVTSNTDSGYIAVDSLAGGRTNTPVKLTPSSISSLTRTFFDDAGLQNARDALKWAPNVVPGDWTAGKRTPFNNWDYNFRGAGQALQGGSGPTRNYFTFYQSADTYNVDRLEFDRGPNSILFGIGSVGGVLTAYTKIPQMNKDFASATLTIDNHGSYRGELDSNQRMGDRSAIRLNALNDHRQGWRDNDRDSVWAMDLAWLFQPTERTSLRLDGEVSRARHTIVPDNYGEAVSYWDGAAESGTWGMDPGIGTGVARMHPWGGPIYPLLVAGQPQLGLQDWSGGYRSDGSYLRVAPQGDWYPDGAISNGSRTLDPDRIPVLPSNRFTFSPGDAESAPEFENLTAWITHSLSDSFDLSVTGYRYTDENLAKNFEAPAFYAKDLNRQLPNGSVNPNFGKFYGDFFLSRQEQRRSVSEGRLQLNYQADGQPAGIPWRQVVSVSAGVQKIRWAARQYNAQILEGGADNPDQNMIWARLYLDTANASVELPENIGGRPVGYASMGRDWFDFDETYDLRNVAVVSHSRLWNDRLSLLLGARYDDYEQHRIGTYSRSETEHGAHGTTYSAGAVYYFGAVGVFANHSRNFDPIGPGKSLGLNGEPFGPAKGKGLEYGLRFASEDNRYYATLARYESTSEDRMTGSKIGFGNIWRLNYLARGEPLNLALTSLNYDDTEDLEVSGYELELTANPTLNWRLQLGFGFPDSEIVAALPGQRAYLATHLPTWEVAAAGTSVDAANLRSALTEARRVLEQNTMGKTKVGLVKYTASAFANYTFREGALDGFSIGGGVSQIGRQYLGEIRDEEIYSSERLSTQLVFAYETTFGDRPTRLALHVDNVLDDRDLVYTGYDATWQDSAGRPVPSGYSRPEPLTLKLSVRMTF